VRHSPLHGGYNSGHLSVRTKTAKTKWLPGQDWHGRSALFLGSAFEGSGAFNACEGEDLLDKEA